MLQVICNCGRIAEVRRGKTGNKLAYTHCVSCKASSKTTEGSKVILENAREDIGKKGDFFEKTTETVQSTATSKTENWQPEANETPEILEGNSEISEADTSPESDKKSGAFTGLKIFLGVVICSALGFTAYNANKG
ncbi:MAG: hypothetical protein ACPGSJ_08480 [Pseudoalteromonas spongiae]